MGKGLKLRICRLLIPCFRPCSSNKRHNDFLWKKDDKWHVIHISPSTPKIHSSKGHLLPLPSTKKQRNTNNKKKKTKKKKRSTSSHRGRISISSADRSHEEEEEETEALVSCSSRSHTPPHHHKDHKLKQRKEKGGWRVEGKMMMRESVAVVKNSEDPYNDFRRSMMEMIVENKLFEVKDLEQLLCCFLSLNSSTYHPIIVHAFTDIWHTLFCFSIPNN